MRLLVISDVHSGFRQLAKILEVATNEKIKGAFACGDITHFKPLDLFKFDRLLDEYGMECIAVHGNCDPPATLELFEEVEVKLIHGKSTSLGEYTIHGVGGSNFTPFFTPSEYSEEEIREFVKNFRYSTKNILVSHCPPHGILDRTYSNVNAGCRAIREISDNFDVILCGHIHEARGKVEGSPLVVNPGPAMGGYFAILDLDSFSVEMGRV
jgi:hypothetical protein